MRDDLLGDVEMLGEGGQFYIFVNGVKIAKRENCQWTNLVPGYSIEDLNGGAKIAIYYSTLPQATGIKPRPSKKSLAEKVRVVIFQILSALKPSIKSSD